MFYVDDECKGTVDSISVIKNNINKHTESIAKAIQVPTDSNKFKSATIIWVHFLIKNS